VGVGGLCCFFSRGDFCEGTYFAQKQRSALLGVVRGGIDRCGQSGGLIASLKP